MDGKIIAICQAGGSFETGEDGTLSYKGGEAHAIDIDDQVSLNEFRKEVAEMFNCSEQSMSFKYCLPSNRRTLITISSDKDLKRMIKFLGCSATVDVYIGMEDVVIRDDMAASGSSRTTLSEQAVSVDIPLDVVDDIVVDTTDGSISLISFLPEVEDLPQSEPLMDMPIEVSPALPRIASDVEKHAKGAQHWQNVITGEGQRFNSVTDFREALRKYAIANQFAFKYKKNDSHRVTVKCKAEGCPWRIHASRLSTTQLICIKKMNPNHTCEGASVSSGHQATRNWVASMIKEKLKVSPDYKPKDIVTDLKREYGIHLNYFQAWRGKEIAKEQIQGSYKEAYSQLPHYCARIMETNPGSLATFTTKEDSSFHRLFVAFHATLFGFQQGCRPLIFLNGLPIKSKYQGTLLTATAADGQDCPFPVAFAVVDAESIDNWHWFLLQLKSALATSIPITFVADRQKGLNAYIPEIFIGSYHAYCLRYLSQQLVEDLKRHFSQEVKRLMVEDLYAAAHAACPEDFDRHLESIKSISVEAYDWIIRSDPQNWANAYFQGARYNHLSSDFGESFYSCVSDAHEMPITQMVDSIRGKIMELIYTCRAESTQWVTKFTPVMEEKLEKEGLNVPGLQVILSAGNSFEVCGESCGVVDIDRWECSCRVWQQTGLPCRHAIAVIRCTGQNIYDYGSRYFSVESYTSTYSESVNPIPDVDRYLRNGNSNAIITVNPPPTRRPPGRPAVKRSLSKEAAKRLLQCSRCKAPGHNKSTCREML
ncbi:hypothetical protein MLD38_027459 [Melastoma candidum]|uniref:Uncharacterized protein n=1 Tax=Melastoma candidum TaxID=119954 RepID=A0ACB9P527_9MYRT|nr:hypothetical protein MLD38_027459 [Melastoma candidum]